MGNKSVILGSKGVRVNISRSLPTNRQNLDFELFWKVWDTLSSDYFDKDKLIDSKMVYGAISGMVAALGDPYTVFLPPSENKVVQEDLNGNFEGIGIQIGFRGTALAVIAPLPGTPAESAGIKAGDYIVGIKDEKKNIDRGTQGITLPDAVEIIRGPAGSTITLALLRDGSEKPMLVDVVRKKIEVPSVVLAFLEENTTAHLKVLKFGGETKAEWDKAILEIIKNPNTKSIVLDLRNNPGGYLQGAVDLASEFLPVSKVVVIEEGKNNARQEYRVTRQGRLLEMPLIVLVNKGSASASEILAGSLRDQRKTKLVGTESFGKGTIQEPMELMGGSGLHITIAKWLTPTGIWVNEKGLEPDVKIEDDDATAQDEQLLKAIELVNANKTRSVTLSEFKE